MTMLIHSHHFIYIRVHVPYSQKRTQSTTYTQKNIHTHALIPTISYVLKFMYSYSFHTHLSTHSQHLIYTHSQILLD